MNKKIFTSLIVLTNFLGFNAYAAIDDKNQDVNTAVENENVGTVSVQSVLAGDGSTQLSPNTDATTYVGAGALSRNADSTLDSDYKWGETPAGSYYCYKNPEGGSNCINCPATNGICNSITTEKLQDESILTVPTGTNLDASGYLTSVEPPVLFEQGGAGYEKYFYRYWNTVGENIDEITEGGEKEGTKVFNWSPSLPQVCFDTFNYETFKNDVKDNAENAKDYFGERIVHYNILKEVNSYEKDENDKRYSVYARVKPETFSDISSGLKSDAEFDTNLNVYAWTKDGRLCLDPNFTPANLRTGNEGKNTYYIDNPNNLSSITLKSGDIKLPCGMFTKTSSTPTPSGYSISGLGTSCTGTNVLRERNGSGLMYTKFKVKLPKPNGKYEDAATHDLNVRACVQCRSLKNECEALVFAVLDKNGCTQGNSNCSGLENAIKELRTAPSFNFSGKTNVDIKRRDVVYNKALQCGDTCLTNVEEHIKTYLGI